MTNKNIFSLFDLYTLKDVFNVWINSWKKMALGMAAFGIFGAYWALSENQRYTAEGSFREKNHTRGGVAASTLSALLMSQSSDSNDSSAVSTMKSRVMMERLIRKLGLQAAISPENSGKSLLGLMYDNLRLEYALFMNRKEPVIADPTVYLKAADIAYSDEVPLGLKIHFLDEKTFVAKTGGWEAKGKLGEPFRHGEIGFTLNRAAQETLSEKTFNMVLFPLHFTASDLSKLVTILTDKDDQTVLRIRYRNENRHRAVAFVNTLMQLYQEHIDTDHKKMMATQITYLQKRQNEVFQTLQSKMRTYAETLSDDFSKLGFIDSQKAMEFLAANQHGIKNKQYAINLELHRLEKFQSEGKSGMESLFGVVESPFINKLLAEIRELKQQYDSVQVALSISDDSKKAHQTKAFEENVATLARLSQCKDDACSLLAMLEEGEVPKTLPGSLASPDLMVETWHAKLVREPSKDLQERFQSYLKNLVHHFEVYSKAVEENLAHQQGPAPEMQGMTLGLVNDLFMNYSREVSSLEGQIEQYSFIIDQLQQPGFELSSLSAILNDPISRDIANNASSVALAINDKGNRTEKELLRLQEELKLQRKFLSLHLQQTKELLQIKLNLLQDKIQAARLTTLAVIQQMVGIAENQIAEQVRSRKNQLHQELALLEKQQEDLQKQMSTLPKQWVNEQLIHQHMEMHRQMGREITSLVESKNISSNLEIMQSAPVDIAIAPLHPDSPRLLFFTFFSAFIGLFMTAAWTLVRALGKGIPVSGESLRYAGLQVAGDLSDREMTLKKAASLILAGSPGLLPGTILVAQGKDSSLAIDLRALFERQGYAAKAAALGSPVEKDGLWTFVYADISPADPEVLTRFDQFDHFIGLLHDETFADLEALIKRIQDSKESRRALFITS